MADSTNHSESSGGRRRRSENHSSHSHSARRHASRGAVPQRSKSDMGRGELMRSSSHRHRPRGTRNDNRHGALLSSSSDHDAGFGDDWFDFASSNMMESVNQDQEEIKRNTNSTRHSTMSASESGDELSGDSFHGDDTSTPEGSERRRPSLTRGNSVRSRGPTRSISDRRKSLQRVQSEVGQGLMGNDRGIGRSHSGSGSRRSLQRQASLSARAFCSSTHSASSNSRRESMKAQYRTSDVDTQSQAEQHTGGLPPSNRRSDIGMNAARRRSSLGHSSHDTSLGYSNHGEEGFSSDLSGGGSNHVPSLQRSKSVAKLEGGALNGVFQREAPTRTRSSDSMSGGLENSAAGATPTDKKWLERRASKQSEIMSLAHDVKERLEGERERHEHNAMHGSSDNLDLHGGEDNNDDDDDQPMAMRTKKTALEQIGMVLTKTGAATRSLGKGTVNAISDPKLAAKRFGHLSKDVGKATIKTALDPMKVAKATKNVTVGSAKMGAGLTKGVAKSTFGATKTVVKGGVSATTTGAKLTMKGTKKVVKGTVRAVKGKDKSGKHQTQGDFYDARVLAERNQSTFYDRITHLVEGSESADDKDKPNDSADGASRPPLKAASILMPTNIVGGNSGSWDV